MPKASRLYIYIYIRIIIIYYILKKKNELSHTGIRQHVLMLLYRMPS